MLLLVEDEAIIALGETMTLERHGYRVLSASTGERAVELATSDPGIDLILMDIDLGSGIDGTQGAEQILEQKDIPIVFLSSHTEPEVVERTEKITSYGYVVKNSGITVLDASIKMALKLFSARGELNRSQEKVLSREKHLFPPQSWDMLSDALENTRVTGIPFDLELETVREDGSHGWMWVKGEAVLDNDGKTTGLWGAAQDITESKRAMEALQTSEEMVKRNHTGGL